MNFTELVKRYQNKLPIWLRILKQLFLEEKLIQEEFQTLFQRDRTTILGIIKGLIEDGIVSKQTDSISRKTLISITRLGRSLVSEIFIVKE